MISTNQFRNGAAIRLDGKRFTILYFQHVKPGKGGAFVRTRLRNIDTGAVVEKTFRAGEKVENVRTESRPMTFLYADGDLYYFMDSETYEQVAIPSEVLDEAVGYIVPNGEASILFADGEVVSVEPPVHVDLEVAETDPGLKGDTATGGSKPATLETGLVVQVPLFVNVGERVRVDTRTKEYLKWVYGTLSSRRTARKNAFLALYQSDVIGQPVNEVFKRWREYLRELDAHVGELDAYAERLAYRVEGEKEVLDERLGKVSVGWPVYRMSAVDRAILRLALYEMLHVEDVPAEVAVNEAIELATGFSSDEAPQFVGGVLGGAKEAWLRESERHDRWVEHG